MNIEVKNTDKLLDYADSIKILENRDDEVFLNKKNEVLWILEHKTVYTAGTSSNDKDVLDRNLKVSGSIVYADWSDVTEVTYEWHKYKKFLHNDPLLVSTEERIAQVNKRLV